MGPGHEGPGDTQLSPAAFELLVEPQWGRGTKAPETPRKVLAKRRYRIRPQWGRGTKAPETWRDRLKLVLPPSPAAMGPGHEGPGDPTGTGG